VKTFELSIDREIQFMIKYQLTPDEFFLMKLIFFAQEGQEQYISQFANECGFERSIREILTSLQNKGVINKSYVIPPAGEVFNPQDVDFNKNVLNQFFQHSQDLGMELFESYPPFTIINGKTFSLRNISKNFKDLDDMCWQYGKMIRFNQQKHEEIMELLEFGKENNLIHSGISDFILSQGWMALQVYKDEDMGVMNTNELL
jgi:hypothetical protein